jgi:hypothetical protein
LKTHGFSPFQTVTVVTEQGERWNASPFLLSKIKSEKGTKEKKGKLIPLEKVQKKEP